MPFLAVPLINEVFHTSYPADVEIVQLRNEHQEADGEIITDSCLKIKDKLYHIECQSTDDTAMAVRMILQQDPDRLRVLLQEYEVIRRKLENVLQGENRSGLYIDLVNLIIKISDYIFRKEKEVRKEIGEVMGGKVLELESERLRAEGEREGKREGKREGEERMAVLINRLILDGRSQEIAAAVNDKNVRKYLFSEYGL